MTRIDIAGREAQAGFPYWNYFLRFAGYVPSIDGDSVSQRARYNDREYDFRLRRGNYSKSTDISSHIVRAYPCVCV